MPSRPWSLPGGTYEYHGALERAHMLAFGLEQVAFGAARLQGAGAAILGARPIGHGAVRAHQASAAERLPAGTYKNIGPRGHWLFGGEAYSAGARS